MQKLTIFTPTYNRGEYLKKLYISLKNQSIHNFEWIIVDDGSTDNTKSIVDSFSDNQFTIKYIYQKNSGKHIAFNHSLDLCTGDLFFCVDSDDYLTPNAIQIIYEQANSSIFHQNEIIGMVGYRIFKDKKISGNAFPSSKNIISYNELYYQYRKGGETALIYKTKIVRFHRFSCYPQENFLSEEILYSKLDNYGKLIIVRSPFYVMEYLEGGLTNRWFQNWIKNPLGAKELLNIKYSHIKDLPCKYVIIKKIKTAIQYNALCFSLKKYDIHNAPSKELCILLIPLSVIYWKSLKNIGGSHENWSSHTKL